jgi:hypothetical protein
MQPCWIVDFHSCTHNISLGIFLVGCFSIGRRALVACLTYFDVGSSAWQRWYSNETVVIIVIEDLIEYRPH